MFKRRFCRRFPALSQISNLLDFLQANNLRPKRHRRAGPGIAASCCNKKIEPKKKRTLHKTATPITKPIKPTPSTATIPSPPTNPPLAPLSPTPSPPALPAPPPFPASPLALTNISLPAVTVSVA